MQNQFILGTPVMTVQFILVTPVKTVHFGHNRRPFLAHQPAPWFTKGIKNIQNTPKKHTRRMLQFGQTSKDLSAVNA